MKHEAVALMENRLPEAGRIRTGVKDPGRGFPKAIDTFRFTSLTRIVIDQLAELYGGEVTPWTPSKGRSEWQVTTNASEIDVVLPRDALSGPVYELWTGGGIDRRCDGEECEIASQSPDGSEKIMTPCICWANQAMECKVTMHLSVVLPNVRFTGAWRLTTHSEFAAREVPGMVEMIQALQDRGLSRALLMIEKRTQIKDGKTKHFRVPVLGLAETPNQIAEGVAGVGSLGSVGPRPALDAGAAPADDDEVAEAEIVDEGPIMNGPQLIAMKLSLLGHDDDVRHAFASAVSDGRTNSTRELTSDEIRRLLLVIHRLEQGEVRFNGIRDGRATVVRAQEEPA